MTPDKIMAPVSVLGSEVRLIAQNSKNGLKSTFCPEDAPVEHKTLHQTFSLHQTLSMTIKLSP